MLATQPEGLDVYTRKSIRRRESGSPNPLIPDQAAALKQGMRGEAAFVLKRKGLFTDEMKAEKDSDR